MQKLLLVTCSSPLFLFVRCVWSACVCACVWVGGVFECLVGVCGLCCVCVWCCCCVVCVCVVSCVSAHPWFFFPYKLAVHTHTRASEGSRHSAVLLFFAAQEKETEAREKAEVSDLIFV
jgi:hypothetical protein